MSSSNKKTFKTSEASKAAGATVTSDAISLDPTTTDHVLVVTANPSIGSGTTTTTETVNVPAQDKALLFQGFNAGDANTDPHGSWFETTDQVFESHDFSNGISFFLGSSIAFFYGITDKQQLLKTEFTDGSYIKVRNGTGTNNLRIEYRDGTAGQVKYFETASHQNITGNSSNTSINDSSASERYHKTAFSFSPNGFKVNVVIDEDTTAKSLVTSSLTATNGASWSELDFSSKTHSKTTLFRYVYGESIGNAWYALLDVFAVAAKEISYATLDPCTHDQNDQAISGGTSAIVDMLSKDYDRFFLFGDGDSDTLTGSSSSGGTIDIKSHGDSAAVSLTVIGDYSNGNPYSPYWYEYFTWYSGKPQFKNSATTTTREVTTSGGSSVSGVVDVELEMSPDGENWCPAQIKSTTTSSGSGSPIVGNEKFVDLSATGIGTDYKNHYARGRKTYDMYTNQLYQNSATYPNEETRPDAVDFMHHMIAVNKSFNYSGWYKTSEQPSSTYNPVLFRHGGQDNFENAKTVQLTDGSGAGTLANTQAGFGETWYFSTFVNEGITPFDDYTIAYWWDSSSSVAPAFSLTSNSTWKGFSSGDSIYGSLLSLGLSYPYYSTATIFNAASNNAPNFTFDGTSSYLIIKRHKLNGDGTATASANVFRDDGTAMVMDGTGGNTQYNFSYTVGSSYTTGSDGSAARSNSTIRSMDECIILGGYVPDANLSTLYSTTATGIGVVDASTLSDIQAWYRFGDNGTDTKAALSNNITNSNRTTQFPGAVNTAFTSSDTIPTLSASHALYSAGPQKTTQNLCEPVSTSTFNNYYLAETTANNTDFYAHFSDIQLTSNKKWCVSFWMKSSIFAASGSGSYGNRIFGNNQGSSAAGFQIRKKPNTTNTWFLFFNGNSGTYLVADYTIPSQHLVNNTWVHVLINYSYDSVANNGLINDSIFLASTDLYINGDVCPKVDNTGYSSTTHATTLVNHGINLGTWANTPNIVEAYDELAYWDGTSLTTSEIAKVYNSGTPKDLQNTTGLTAPDHWWRHEDSSNLTYDTIAGANSGIIAGATQTAITSSDSIASVPEGVFDNLFTTTSNLSISGWFKTVNGATGTLFSNTGGAATTGMVCEVTGSNIGIAFKDGSPSPIVAVKGVNDGEWHHLVITKNDAGTNEFKIYVDGVLYTTSAATGLTNTDLKGSNGFTLLGDGQNNANATNPSGTDNSKLQATLSNWSLHSEVLDQYAVKQLYSNGHVRNIKNLPSVTVGTPGSAPAIEAWWQLNNTTNPQNDLVGSNHLQYFKSLGTSAIYSKAIEEPAGVADNALNNNTSNSLEITATSGTHINPFKLSTDSSSDVAPLSGGLGFCCQYKMDTMTGNASGFERKNIMTVHYAATGYYLDVSVERIANSSDVYLMVWIIPGTNHTGSNLKYMKWAGNTGLFDGNWHQLIVNWDGSVANNAASTIKVFVDGVQLSTTGDGGTTSITHNYQSVDANDVAVFGNTTVSKVTVLGNNGWSTSGNSNMIVKQYIDNVGFWSGITNSNLTQTIVDDLYANDNDLESVTGLTFKSLFLMGDGPNDDESTLKSCDIIQASSYRALTKQSNAAQIRYTVPSNEAPYRASSDLSTTDLTGDLVPATGATLIQDSLNGNAMTLSITKNFDFTSESWVTDSSGEAAFCLSFNGHEEQAEYFALWKCNQTSKSINFLDGNWHNVVLSYRASSAEGQNVRFGPLDDINNKQDFNWNLSVDGREYNDINSSIGADYIGGLNTLLVETVASNSENTGFAIYNRHLKYDTSNNEETYKAHGQAGSNITEDSGANSPNAYQGSIDETSFHSQNFWVSSGGEEPTNFESEYPATIYGNTTGLSGTRGTGATYGVGIPYPLLDPAAIGATVGTSQYVNPNRYDASTNPGGGLEAWWRWGDTDGDCAENINDACDFAIDITNNNHDLRAQNFNTDEIVSPTSTPETSTGESIYLASQEASSQSTTTTLINVVIEGIVDTACNVKNLALPVLQYLRVKFTGAGSAELGSGKTEASLWYAKRRKR